MHKRSIDLILCISVIFLTIFGLVMVYSASNVVALEKYNDGYYYFKRQALFAVISLIVMLIIIKANVVDYQKYASYFFAFCFCLLIIVLIPGIGVVRGGARSWIGVSVFSIQPSEFMKLGLIGIIAKYLATNRNDLEKPKNFITLSGLIFIIFFIIMLQPDFGTGLVILLSCFLLIYISGAPKKYFIYMGIVGIIGAVLLIISAPYRMLRIMAFINPWEDPLGSGFQGIQSLFAITPGGLFGHGYNNSMQKHFFLPEPQNDFIYAIILEELGLIGGFIVLFFYFIIIYRGIKISMSVDNEFLRYLSLGIVINLFVQVFINVGVVVGLLPVTGITLPLFSYGGSSLFLTLFSLAILISISKYQNYDYR